jgi:hypothetical protein
MSVTLTLYHNNSDKRVVSKNLVQYAQKDIQLKGDVDVMDPTLIVTGNADEYAGVNYFHVSSFGRYYFITGIRALPGGLVEITGHVDVLTSSKSLIMPAEAIIDKQETYYNLYLNDGSFQACVNDIVQTKEFTIGAGEGFGSPGYVLVIAG